MRFLAFLVFLLLFGPASAEPPNPLKVEMLSSAFRAEVDKPFLIGFRLTHAPEHHSYWKSPGIVGLPTSVKWKAPEGVVIGPLQWPVPARVDMAGHNAHGYREQTLLMAEVTIKPEWGGKELILEGAISWMCCHKTCHPGHQAFQFVQPTGITGKPAPREILAEFEQAQALHPVPSNGWEVSGQLDQAKVTLKVKPTKEGLALPKELYFFSDQNLGDTDQPQKLIVNEGEVQLEMTRAQFGPENPTKITGLLHRPDGWGTHEGKTGQYLPVEILLPKKESDR